MANLLVGIVGLPNVGKSTVFNALVSSAKAKVGKYPFTTVEKNMGTVNVPDDALFELAKLENIEKVTPATVEIVDIAGLIKGAHEGEGLGNQFLHYIREVDVILQVVRFFQDEKVPHVHQQIDPQDDIEIVNDELILKDIETLEHRLTREKVSAEEKDILQRFTKELNQGKLASEIEVSEKELPVISQLFLLTGKKQVLLANIGEEDLKNPPLPLSICAKLESDLAQFPWTERQQFLKEYGIAKSAREEIIRAVYEALEVITFYTIAKRKEARAWTIRLGSTSLMAAAKVHTDFAKHFIKVEVINVDELLVHGSHSTGSGQAWNKAHELGKIALHGRDYIVQDGDVIEFKINVG